jgi:NAD(P)-dependent dehydrogenase (short-subunit alcohol dehydrogenase family)
MTRLQDKTLLITGGTSGIGRDAVLRCLQEGARVIFTGRDVERAQQTIAAAGALGANAEFIVQDVTSEQDWSTVCESIENKYGHLDGLVNNAGVFAHSAIEDTFPGRLQMDVANQCRWHFSGNQTCNPASATSSSAGYHRQCLLFVRADGAPGLRVILHIQSGGNHVE